MGVVAAESSPRRSAWRSSSDRPADPRRALGHRGEELASTHLQRLGFTLLARNARTPRGEIDLIAFDGRVLAFVEVKTRRVGTAVRRTPADRQPLAGLGVRQRLRLRALAAAWLADRSNGRPTAQTIRFDAIGVLVDGAGGLLALDHLEGAW